MSGSVSFRQLPRSPSWEAPHGVPQSDSFEPVEVERLRDVGRRRSQCVGAVRHSGKGVVEDDRRAERGEAELGGDAGGGVEVEKAEPPGFALRRGSFRPPPCPPGCDPDNSLPDSLSSKGETRGVWNCARACTWAERWVDDQPRRHLDPQIAHVAVGEDRSRLVFEFAARSQTDVKSSW